MDRQNLSRKNLLQPEHLSHNDVCDCCHKSSYCMMTDEMKDGEKNFVKSPCCSVHEFAPQNRLTAITEAEHSQYGVRAISSPNKYTECTCMKHAFSHNRQPLEPLSFDCIYCIRDWKDFGSSIWYSLSRKLKRKRGRPRKTETEIEIFPQQRTLLTPILNKNKDDHIKLDSFPNFCDISKGMDFEVNGSSTSRSTVCLGILNGKEYILHEGLAVHVIDHEKVWWPGIISNVKDGQVLVSFEDWPSSCDKWLDSCSKRLRLSSERAIKGPYMEQTVSPDSKPFVVPGTDKTHHSLAVKRGRGRPKGTTKDVLEKRKKDQDEIPPDVICIPIPRPSTKQAISGTQTFRISEKNTPLNQTNSSGKSHAPNSSNQTFGYFIQKSQNSVSGSHENESVNQENASSKKRARGRPRGTTKDVLLKRKWSALGRLLFWQQLGFEFPFDLFGSELTEDDLDENTNDRQSSNAITHSANSTRFTKGSTVKRQAIKKRKLSDGRFATKKTSSASLHQTNANVASTMSMLDRGVFPTRKTLASLFTVDERAASDPSLPVGTRVVITDQDKLELKGTVIAISGTKRLVRYDDWNPSLDEWIVFDSCCVRVLDTVETVQSYSLETTSSQQSHSRITTSRPRLGMNGMKRQMEYRRVSSSKNTIARCSRDDSWESWKCRVCESSEEEEDNVLVLCDGCSSPYHQTCHEPIINRELILNPDSKWFCFDSHCQQWEAWKCKMCNKREESRNNSLVICENCNNAFHQKCHAPLIDNDIVFAENSKWFCSNFFCQETKRQLLQIEVNAGDHGAFLTRRALQELLVEATSALENNGIRSCGQDLLALNSNADQGDKFFSPFRHIEVADTTGNWWVAQMLEKRGNRILIRYCGWGCNYDEWIPQHSDRIRTREVSAVDNGGALDTPLSLKQPEIYFCDQCQTNILDERYYCTYCEKASRGCALTESYQLCLFCFSCDFPDHVHPRSSFAVQSVVYGLSNKGSLTLSFAEDVFDTEYVANTGHGRPSANVVTSVGAMSVLQSMSSTARVSKTCAFCNDDSTETMGPFIGPYPFTVVSDASRRIKVDENDDSDETRKTCRKRVFWAHDSCARLSPEVYVRPSTRIGEPEKWYNVAKALRRGRTRKCSVCRERGATIGCFDKKCNRAFHLKCTGKPVSHFQQGIIFWCQAHESLFSRIDDYDEIYSCDGCTIQFGGGSVEAESWYTCHDCVESDLFYTFDLCASCFHSNPLLNHEHPKSAFKETNIEERIEIKIQEEAQLTQQLERTQNADELLQAERERRAAARDSSAKCSYCWTKNSQQWHRCANGILVCEECFSLAPSAYHIGAKTDCGLECDLKDGPGIGKMDGVDSTLHHRISLVDHIHAETDGHTHGTYSTRNILQSSSTLLSSDLDQGQLITKPMLTCYGPRDDQLYSLFHDTTYYDIPTRAPRWATHSGSDYHGSWLPQIVRWSLLRYTEQGDRVFSNFLGRGTDAIESLLLKRRCCGVDINPAAVRLAQRNCSFVIPKKMNISAVYRPIIFHKDSRDLKGPLFRDESFDHILSHPPYKDCIAYSTHIEGDISRFPDPAAFQAEMAKVVSESKRVLKMNHRVTMGIGDNRKGTFYIPVSFETMSTYMKAGFELEELFVKRQRHCQMTQLGTYLGIQYDFLMFTHEFIAIFRKVPDPPPFPTFEECQSKFDFDIQTLWRVTETIRAIPTFKGKRSMAILGTVWTMRPRSHYTWKQVLRAKIVQRFGKDYTTWIELSPKGILKQVLENVIYHDLCAERDGSDLDQSSQVSGHTDLEVPEYEKDRIERIRSNQQQLQDLGLVKHQPPDIDDCYLTEVLEAPKFAHDHILKGVSLILLPHLDIPTTAILNDTDWVWSYRTFVVAQAKKAATQLLPGSLLIIGIKDFRIRKVPCSRVPCDINESGDLDMLSTYFETVTIDEPSPILSEPGLQTIYVPLTILLFRDLQDQLHDQLVLKEFFIALPDGYECNRYMNPEEAKDYLHEEYEEWKAEKLAERLGKKGARRVAPIVQSHYLVYMKPNQAE